MEYVPLEGSTLELELEGLLLDMRAMGVLHLSLADIVDNVGYGLLIHEGLLGPHARRRPQRHLLRGPIEGAVVRCVSREIRVGSLWETANFLIPAVLADPDVRAVLHGLASNIIFYIGTSYRAKRLRSSEAQDSSVRRPYIEVGPEVRTIVFALAQAGGGRLRMRSRRGDHVDDEIELVVNSNDV